MRVQFALSKWCSVFPINVETLRTRFRVPFHCQKTVVIITLVRSQKIFENEMFQHEPLRRFNCELLMNETLSNRRGFIITNH